MAEIAFCDEERRKAVIEEPLLVVMPASDITDEMRTLAETYADKLAKTQRERNNEYKLVQSKAT